jgi:hypothetical protein
MKENKYRLPSIIVWTVMLIFFFAARYGSYSINMVILGIPLCILIIATILSIIGRKNIKNKWTLPTLISLLSCYILAVSGEYIKNNHIKDKNITLTLYPIVLLVFLQLGLKCAIPTIKDEKRIKALKNQMLFGTVFLVIVELIILYIICT